jgi:Xaa-Pro aminopeptidase
MLNLRGGDIAFNPVFYASLVVPVVGHPTLFINIDQLPQDVYDYLMKNQILIEPYESIEEYLRTVGKGLKDGVRRLFLFFARWD